MENKSQDQQEQFKRESLARGDAFSQMTQTPGWKLVSIYIENKIKSFASRILTEEKDITEYEKERSEIRGLRKLIGYIESDIKTLKDESKNTRPT